MLRRFTGTVEPFAECNVTDLITWITDIPFDAWPQQTPADDGGLRPAMVNDPAWYDFGKATDPLVHTFLDRWFVGAADQHRMLSVVMPGHTIPTHADAQAPDWLCRVHVPLTTNPRAGLGMPDGAWWLRVGRAYRLNTEVPHAIWNYGPTPRIHFMFDVVAAP